jgi:hypothetical protein
MDRIIKRNGIRIVAIWAAMALVLAAMLLLSGNRGNTTGPEIRPLGGAKLAVAIPTTITLTYDGTSFTGTVSSSEVSCEVLQPITISQVNPGSVPLTQRATAVSDQDGNYTSTPWAASSGEKYVASIPEHPTVPPGADPCAEATSNTYEIP